MTDITAIGSMPSVTEPTPLPIVSAMPSVTEEIVEEANKPPPHLPTAAEMVENGVDHLGSKKLINGYAMYITEQNNFQTWMHLAKEDKRLWLWFHF